MKNSRREFIKVAGISALGAAAASPVLNAFASGGEAAHEEKAADVKQEVAADSPYKTNKGALQGSRWGLVINTLKIDAKIAAKITAVCHAIHNVPEIPNKKQEMKWIWPDKFEHVFPDKEDPYLAEKYKEMPIMALCNHCDNPPCVRACPTKATFKNSEGIVMMDFHRCIGCRFCMAACPYGSRSFNFSDPRKFLDPAKIDPAFPTRMKGVVEKCNLCAERLALGKVPACVEASEGAIVFGDLADPKSEVRKLLNSNFTIRRKESLGTLPSVYYII